MFVSTHTENDTAHSWRKADGTAITCDEKRKILHENEAEIREICEQALADAVLMGCGEEAVKEKFIAIIRTLKSPWSGARG